MQTAKCMLDNALLRGVCGSLYLLIIILHDVLIQKLNLCCRNLDMM